jgi:hypothetical protein
MSQENPFVLPKESYQRNLNPLAQYVEDAASFLATSTGRDVEECKAWVRKQLSASGRFPFQDPKIKYLERQKNGDRKEKEGTLWGYLSDSIQKRHLIAPTFTTYLNEADNKSVLVDFIDGNVKARSVAKKAKFAAKMAENYVLVAIKETEQLSRKIANNSISGAHVSNSTPLFNKTAHSTLTSNCRSTSGFGNANNEKLLSGNRHYWNAKITLNNIVSIVNHTDYERLQKVMDRYQIHYPSVDEVMEVITYSTDLYWHKASTLKGIRKYVEKLSALQRAAFVYTGDLYHLAKYNDKVVRELMDRLTKIDHDITQCDDPGAMIKAHREEYVSLAKQFYPDQMRGKDVKDVKGQPVEKLIALSVKNIHETIMDHADLIQTLFVTENVPASLAFLPESIRRSALTSDTDSTIFTVQDWTFWHRGPDADFGPRSQATEALMIFLAAETITHILARMSANFGITTERIHQVAMKNEYKFDIFTPTQVGKHYFALKGCQEGNLFKKYEMEIKGVHLKNSALPKSITERAEEMMREVMETVMAGKKIKLLAILKEVADIERNIKNSILKGESTYFRNLQIKTANSYTKGPTESPYQHYTMWETVFAPKYGPAPLPPYAALGVNVDLKSATMLKEWVATIKDRALAERLDKYLKEKTRNGITSLALPVQCLQIHGLPEEVADVLNVRKIVFGLVMPFYIVLEALGWYALNDQLSKMCSDFY